MDLKNMWSLLVGLLIWADTAHLQTTTVGGVTVECPELCSCNETTADCSGKQLREWPTDLPQTMGVILMQNNRIRTIPTESIISFANLTKLNLNHNDLKTLELELPQNLRQLSAVGNRIASVNVTISQSNLKTFQISDNRLTTIPVLPTSLEILEARENRIRELTKNDFSSVPNLEELHLSHNRINKIANDTFVDLTKLKVLDIALNFHEGIHPRWFRNKPELNQVLLRSYSLHCDCQLLKVNYLLSKMELEVDDLPRVSCATPEEFKNQLVSNVTESGGMQNCQLEDPVKEPRPLSNAAIFAVVVSVALLLAFITLTLFLWMRKKQYIKF